MDFTPGDATLKYFVKKAVTTISSSFAMTNNKILCQSIDTVFILT